MFKRLESNIPTCCHELCETLCFYMIMGIIMTMIATIFCEPTTATGIRLLLVVKICITVVYLVLLSFLKESRPVLVASFLFLQAITITSISFALFYYVGLIW